MTKREWIEITSLIDDEYVDKADPKKTDVKAVKRPKRTMTLIAAAILTLTAAIVIVFWQVLRPAASTTFPSDSGGAQLSTRMLDFLAYSWQSPAFDKDDVNITIYFGCFYQTDRKRNIPVFDIFCYEDGVGDLPIRHAEEEYYSYYKYLVTMEIGEEGSKYYIKHKKYSHSEMIHVPQELFVNERGYFFIKLFGKDNSDLNSDLNESVKIGYEVIGDKVLLSSARGYEFSPDGVFDEKYHPYSEE